MALGTRLFGMLVSFCFANTEDEDENLVNMLN